MRVDVVEITVVRINSCRTSAESPIERERSCDVDRDAPVVPRTGCSIELEREGLLRPFADQADTATRIGVAAEQPVGTAQNFNVVEFDQIQRAEKQQIRTRRTSG